jgi:hypothetical protein
VTIVDRDERDEQNLITRRNVAMREQFTEENRLLFHPNCGSHAAVISGGLSAHRPNAGDDFNFGVVLTNRPLKTNEIFEVRLDKMCKKWAGSIELGKFEIFKKIQIQNHFIARSPNTSLSYRSLPKLSLLRELEKAVFYSPAVFPSCVFSAVYITQEPSEQTAIANSLLQPKPKII